MANSDTDINGWSGFSKNATKLIYCEGSSYKLKRPERKCMRPY